MGSGESNPEGKGKKLPLAVQIQAMTVPERIRLAMVGGKEARSILVRDPNRMVQLAVVENPKITPGEVASICQSKGVTDEVLRKIAGNREWIRLYPVRLGLVKNPKTPVGIALRLVGSLSVQDLKILAKSKQVPSVVAQAAKRSLAQKSR